MKIHYFYLNSQIVKYQITGLTITITIGLCSVLCAADRVSWRAPNVRERLMVSLDTVAISWGGWVRGDFVVTNSDISRGGGVELWETFSVTE